MTPQTPPTEAPKSTLEVPKPAAPAPQAQTPPSTSPQRAQASEPVLAKPPEGVEFTEVSDEPQTPITPGTVTQPVVVAAEKPKKQKAAKTGPKGPGRIITFAVVIFVVLVGLAYYAYTQSV